MNDHKYIFVGPSLLVLLMLSACAAPERVILLPDTNGKSTAVIVTGKGGKSATLDQPYAAALISSGDTKTERVDASFVTQRYGDVIAAIPVTPKKFLIYFAQGSNELTPESSAILESLQLEMKNFPAPEIIVIGHTDRVGSVESNDALSAKRAEFIRSKLVANGIDNSRITSYGRGEREPLIPTEDEVPEPRNRRVEIKIR